MDKKNIDINNSSLILHNQDLEEAEELEERKRREEEMHHLISQAMGQFNFEEQSTLNSSITSNETDNSIQHNNLSLTDHYREISDKDQLKTLYDIRVREVQSLNKEIDKLKEKFNEQHIKLRRQVTLLEAEIQQKNISLTESQKLLVEKTEHFGRLKDEMTALNNNIKSFESKTTELQEENEVLRQLNMGLENQILIAQKGCPLLSNSVDKEFQESQRIKIQQLEHALQQAQEETTDSIQRRKKLQDELKRSICERENDVLKKNMVINALSDQNQNLQQQINDYSKTIEEQRSKLDLTNNRRQHLEEEIRRFQEKRQITEELRETIWKEATGEFQPRIASLNLENERLKQQVIAFEDQGYPEKISILKAENGELQKKIIELEIDNSMDERAMQTSLPFVNNAEFMCIEEQLKEAQSNITKLQNTIRILQEDNFKLQTKIGLDHSNQGQLEEAQNKVMKLEHKLQTKIGLEQERETLIKELQQKATKFEKIIRRPKEMTSVGVNTTSEHMGDTSLLKVQHDTLMYQTEAKLHKKLKKEFDDKLAKTINTYSTLYKCQECSSLKEENDKLREMRQTDREAVLKLVTMWETKFRQFENDTEVEMLQLLSSKAKSESDVTQMKQKLEEFTETHKQMQDQLKKHDGSQFENYKKELVSQTVENYTVLNKHLNRIKGKILLYNKETRDSERRLQEFSELSK